MTSTQASPRPFRGKALDLLLVALALGAIRRTFHDSQLNSEDFHVYWKAAHLWLQGGDPYAFTAADQGFVFKYPPWILPLFLPIGLMPFETARLAWYAIELLCIAYVIRWCIRKGAPRRLAALLACFFWWMFHAHFSAGQFTLVLLVISLWAFDRPPRARVSGLREALGRGFKEALGLGFKEALGLGFKEALLAYILSAKVFSVATLAGIWRRFVRPAPWLWGLGLFVATHLGVLAAYWIHGTYPFSLGGAIEGLTRLYQGFRATAASGGAELGEIIVRGQGNHGFTALILRTLHVDSQNFAADALTSLSLMALLGALWVRHSQKLTAAEQWAGWIAIGLVTHPLAWHHSFVLAYPLCTLSAARAASTRDRRLLALSLLGASFIGLCIPQVLGKTLVKPIELAGVKSWGVVLAAVALVLSSREGRSR